MGDLGTSIARPSPRPIFGTIHLLNQATRVIHVIAETPAEGENMIAIAEETTDPKAKKGARRRAQNANVAPKKGKSGKTTTSFKKRPKRAKVPREGTKTAMILGLLEQEGGVTMAALRKATGWKAESVRSYMVWTIRRRLGYRVICTRGVNTYALKS